MSENGSPTQNYTNSYDVIPYEGYPFAQTSPYHMKTLAKLFGFEAPAVEKAKILELGCANGGNLISLAQSLPKAKLLGIDYSQVQIDTANSVKNSIGLDNVEFKCMSIEDFKKKEGKFDYIICHGVISWVPDNIRNKILEICQNNLSEKGVAYISYNTLPGWNTVRTIRDMMLHHSQIFADTKDKIQQARLLLNFVKDSVQNSNTPHSQILKAEAELLSNQPDHYIAHEYLESDNNQYYFKDFMELAAKHNLQYLADSTISSMFVGNMPKNVAEKLAEIKDIVRTEQYMDFITNRRFRCTLLCNKSVQINRNLNSEDIKKFYTKFYLVPETPITNIDTNDKINGTENVKFYFKGDKNSEVATTSKYLKAIFYVYAEHPNRAFSFNEITKLAAEKLQGNPLKETEQEFVNHMMRLVLQGFVTITLKQDENHPKIEKPKLNKVAHYQAKQTQNLWLTNLNHEIVPINAPEKLIFKYLDGENDFDKIVELIKGHINTGELSLSKDGNKIENPEDIAKELKVAVESTITKAKLNHLLV